MDDRPRFDQVAELLVHSPLFPNGCASGNLLEGHRPSWTNYCHSGKYPTANRFGERRFPSDQSRVEPIKILADLDGVPFKLRAARVCSGPIRGVAVVRHPRRQRRHIFHRGLCADRGRWGRGLRAGPARLTHGSAIRAQIRIVSQELPSFRRRLQTPKWSLRLGWLRKMARARLCDVGHALACHG